MNFGEDFNFQQQKIYPNYIPDVIDRTQIYVQLISYHGYIIISNQECITIWSLLTGAKISSIEVTNAIKITIYEDNLYFLSNGNLLKYNMKKLQLEIIFSYKGDNITCFYMSQEYICCGSENGNLIIWKKIDIEPFLIRKCFETPISFISINVWDSSLFLTSGSLFKVMFFKNLKNFEIMDELNHQLNDKISFMIIKDRVLYITHGRDCYIYDSEDNSLSNIGVPAPLELDQISNQIIKNNRAADMYILKNIIYGFLNNTN